MNSEQVNAENEAYSLFTISWDQLTGCTEMGGQNMVIKPMTQQAVQLANNGNSGVQQQEVIHYILLSEQEHGDIPKLKDVVPVVPDLPTEKPPTASNEATYPKCKTSQTNGTKDRRVGKREYSMKCPQCDKDFTRLSEYRQHVLDHRNTKKYKCEHCSASYNIEKNFTVHMAMHGKGQPNCPICDRKFQRLASLKSHLMLHQVEETFACNTCLSEFEKEEDLNDHLESHRTVAPEIETENLPLICSFCSYLFQDKSKYKEHIMLHMKAKRIVNSARKYKRRNVNTNRDHPHKCDQCPKSFAKVCLLDRHRRIHTGEKPFICEICHRGFSQNGTLQIHLNKHKGKKPFQCVFCEAKFSQKGNLRVHLEKTHMTGSPGEKVYKCIHCTCIFKKVSSLNGHITKVHLASFKDDNGLDVDQVMDQVKELDKQASRLPTAGKEPEMRPTRPENGPPKVDETFVRIADSSVEGPVRRYIIKQRRYGEARWYICSYCNKEFKKPSDLIRHIRIHTREKPFQCRLCGQTFALKSTLQNHQNTHERQSCECVICLKKFNSIRMLNVHLRRHDRSAIAHKTRSYKCSLCDRTFVSLEAAKVHMQVHDLPETIVISKEAPELDVNAVMKQPMLETENGLFSVAAPKPKTPYASMEQYKNRPFKCHVCNAAFLKNVHLKRHMLMHTGKKDYKCEYCPKSFFTNYALKEHVNYHTKTKNHECKHCKKHFYTNSILQKHLLMHSSLKPYLCPYCKKRFKQAQLCRKHIRKTHKRDLNESLVAMTETGELSLEATKILDLTDMLNDSAFSEVEDDAGKKTLTPIETYSNISTLDNRSLLKESLVGSRKVKRKSVLQSTNRESEADKVKPAEVIVKEVEEKPAEETRSEYNPNEMNEVSIENLQDSSISYPTIYISTEDLQLLSNSNVVNSLLPQLKLENTDPLLLSSINELQDPNILYPMDSSITQEEADYQTVTPNYNTFNPNLIFNPNMSDLNLNIQPDKDADLKKDANYTNEQIDLEINQIAAQKVDAALGDNLIIFNRDVQKNVDMNYYNINFSQNDYIDINTLNLPANTSIGKVMQPDRNNLMCSNCRITFKNIDEINVHICGGLIEGEVFLEHTEGINDGVVESLMDEEQTEKTNETTAPEEFQKPETSQFECSFCEKTFPLKTAFVRHMSAKHKDMVNKSCTYCVKKFKKQSDLMRHLRTHTGEKPFACGKCEKSFSLKSTLMSHLRTHNPIGTKGFNCQVCNTSLSCKSSLKKHIQIHADTKTFACEVCSMKFRTISHKKSHMLTHTKQSKNKNSKKIGTMNLLESVLMDSANGLLAGYDKVELLEGNQQLQDPTHNLLTTDLPIAENLVLNEGLHFEPILLQLPNNVYTTLQFGLDGQLHVKQTDSDSLMAPEQQILTNAEDLVRPPKDKKVQCDICTKWYASRSVLGKHKRLLHGQHKCSKCSKAFDSTDLLDKHSRLHFGYRPFSCSLCANSFTEEASLKIHMKRIHNVDSANTIEVL